MLLKAFLHTGYFFRREKTPRSREREQTGLLQLMAHQNPPPSKVPVPMAAPKVVGVDFISFVENEKIISQIAPEPTINSRQMPTSWLPSPASPKTAGKANPNGKSQPGK